MNFRLAPDRMLPLGVALLAAGLGGLGLILWVASHWGALGRTGQFALLQGSLLVMCAGALWRPVARLPLALLALLLIGGLFAYFGQTYQTGADAWQLFALWAALALPLCLGLRHDALWLPWALVASTAIALWVRAHTGHQWRVAPDDLVAHLMGWLAGAGLVVALSPHWRAQSGAGAWSLRLAATLWVVGVTATALGGLFHDVVAPHYGLGLLLMAGAAGWWALAAPEIFVLSAIALCLNTLLVCGLARLLLHDSRGDAIGSLFLLGLVAAGLLAGTVSLLMRVARRLAPGSAA